MNACDRPAITWGEGKTELNAARPQERFQFLFLEAQRDKAEVHQIGIAMEESAFFENLEALVFVQATICEGCNH